MSYSIVIPARNEEKFIEKTLLSIKNQTVKPKQIIFINDGSTDKTLEIASKYVDLIINLDDRGFRSLSYDFIEILNKGLKKINIESTYVLICGSDNILCKNYCAFLIGKLESNPKLVIASGKDFAKPNHSNSPTGIRMVNLSFWRKLNKIKYPVIPGYEAYLFLKAQQLGFKAKCYREVYFQSQRKPSIYRDLKKANMRGKAMYLLGYSKIYALGRILFVIFRNPLSGLNMLNGFLSSFGRKKLDICDFVKHAQRKQIKKLIKTTLLHFNVFMR